MLSKIDWVLASWSTAVLIFRKAIVCASSFEEEKEIKGECVVT